MQAALFISLWVYLFCLPLSEPGQVFGWLRNLIYQATRSQYTNWLFAPLIGCPKCHAGQIAFWWQAYCFTQTGEFSLPFILIAIAGAYALQTWHLIVEKYLNK